MAELDYGVLQAEFGLPYQLINAVPELKRLAERMVREDWTADRVKAAIQGTNWWKNNSEKQRQYIIKSVMDPATIRQDMDNAKFKVKALLASMGYTNVAESYLDRMAHNLLYEGWDEARIKYDVGVETANGGFRGMMESGEAGDFANKMRSLAYQNGIELTDDWYTNYYSGILRGTATMEQAARDIRNQAAAKFSGFHDQIMAGQNVMDIASPYMQSMGNILEINTQSLNLFDPTIVEALNYRDDKGGVGSKPLWKFEVDLKRDPRWLSTNNAREGMMSVAHKVAQDMGVAY